MSVSPASLLAAVRLLALGGLGGALASALHIPGGWLTGSVVAVMLLKVLRPDTDRAPRAFGEAGKILLGTFVGATFNRELLAQLGGLLPMAIASTAAMIAVSALLAWAMSRLTSLDIGTALFSITPGGMPEMIAASEDTGADLATVATLQFLRYASVIVLVPLIVSGWFS